MIDEANWPKWLSPRHVFTPLSISIALLASHLREATVTLVSTRLTVDLLFARRGGCIECSCWTGLLQEEGYNSRSDRIALILDLESNWAGTNVENIGNVRSFSRENDGLEAAVWHA